MTYNTDFYNWSQQTAERLRRKQFDQIDWGNLIEEIEDMGRKELHAIESFLLRLVEHTLKYKYWESEREWSGRHWQSEIVNFRYQLKKRLDDSPSIRARLPEIYQEILPVAIASVSKLCNLPDAIDLVLEEILEENPQIEN